MSDVKQTENSLYTSRHLRYGALDISPRSNGEFSKAIQSYRRRYELDSKRCAETLTPAEHEELLALIEQNEQADADRLRCLLEEAQIQGVSLDELMEQLGLSAPPPVYG